MAEMNYEISNVYRIIDENYSNRPEGEMQRLLHGRGGEIEHCSFLNADLFPPALLVTLYEKRNHSWKSDLSELIFQLDGIKTIVFQDRTEAPWINDMYGNELPENHIVEEKGLKYSVSLRKGENPGIFPDMKEGRFYIREISSGKKVLNLFSYTCGFSVSAIEGGAESVLNMDMNSNSLNRGRVNHELNHHDKSKISYLSHNILKSFGKITKKGPYDLIIIDPPPSQGSSFNLERDYGKVLRKCNDILSPDGEILACLNSHSLDFQWFKSFIETNLGNFENISQFGAGEDFPERNSELGLKIIHLKIKKLSG
jgi:23S rRNA (cytosine1962-C5)-methyltransferase